MVEMCLFVARVLAESHAFVSAFFREEWLEIRAGMTRHVDFDSDMAVMTYGNGWEEYGGEDLG